MRSVKQEPVKLKKEVLGFVVNRLQFALLAETWRLVADGVIGVNDVDAVMSAGLGPRYAFNGTCETVHLNAFGVRDYFKRYAAGITAVRSLKLVLFIFILFIFISASISRS